MVNGFKKRITSKIHACPMPKQAMSQLNDKIVDACGREKSMEQLPGTSGQAGHGFGFTITDYLDRHLLISSSGDPV